MNSVAPPLPSVSAEVLLTPIDEHDEKGVNCPMLRCARCGSETLEGVKFCPSCGRKFVPQELPVSAGEDGLYRCWRHKKVTTRVTCGRCEKPICERCMTVGANGVRCWECAKNRVPVRFGGLIHDAGRSVGGAAQNLGSRPIWYLWLWSMIIRIIMSFFGRG